MEIGGPYNLLRLKGSEARNLGIGEQQRKTGLRHK